MNGANRDFLIYGEEEKLKMENASDKHTIDENTI